MKEGAMRNNSRRGKHLDAARRQRGVSLIEVLVAVVVLGVGLLGTAALQATALRGGQSSFESSMAVAQTNSILESIRANAGEAESYNVGRLCAVPAATGTRAERDIGQWMTDLKTSIGGGPAADTTTCGTIDNCPLDCTITVEWDDQRAGGPESRSVVTRTRI
ncbi:type IV pilus modification protein PilV [Luteimonas sp. 3794]|uniref:type IV pilus modification protein PilV n=1 Tax=Luteimonas sp. 3794 TaxID=2817730 RepID=UPI002865331E|nr:type IV pilus modification protein PilV [Luteimonas sp. 3794]MDR6992783.1 type IV pilus assembly protein PilV [Luteimonas sp. 3794]